MSGLVKKELLLFQKKLKNLSRIGIILFGVFLFIILFGESGGVLILSVLLPVFLTVYVTSNSQEDEVAKWDFFLKTFPLSSKQIVLSRYFAFGLLVLGSTVFMLLVSSLTYVLFENYSLWIHLIFIGVGLILSVICLSILVPVNYYSGYQGGVSIMIGSGLLISALTSLAEAGIIDPFAWQISGEMFAVLLVMFTIILAIASIVISIFIYARKEF